MGTLTTGGVWVATLPLPTKHVALDSKPEV